ncbi:MAG: hypothetical protein ACRCX1_07255 [Bacteroidales bacterium]
MEKLKIDQAFKVMLPLLKTLVPPCVGEGNEVTNYAVYADNGEKKRLFAEIVLHGHVLTIQFNQEMSKDEAKQIFSHFLLTKMNEHGRVEVREIEEEIRKDIQDAIQKLMRYFSDKGWFGKGF